MSCDYCFYCDEAAKREHRSYGMMSEDTIKNVIRKVLFQAHSDVCFAFQGGEPTLRGLPFFEKVIEFENRYNRNGVRISNTLQTNGLLLDKSWCDFFRENHFLIGVSVDGTQKTHDACRHTKQGSPTYEQILETIRLFDRYQVEYNILTVVNACTAPEIKTIYYDYREKGWNYQQYIACLDPLGDETGTLPCSLSPRQYGQFLVNLFNLWYKDWRRGKSPYIRDFENYIGILMGYPPEACAQRGICTVQGVVEADGSVYPCDFYALDEYRLGNVNQDRIADLLAHKRAEAFICESEKISDSCRACRHYLLCRGGCRRTRVKDPSGSGFRSRFCESYRMFFDQTRQRMEEIADYLRD